MRIVSYQFEKKKYIHSLTAVSKCIYLLKVSVRNEATEKCSDGLLSEEKKSDESVGGDEGDEPSGEGAIREEWMVDG